MIKQLHVVHNNKNSHDRLDSYIREGKEIFHSYDFPFKWEDNKWRGFGIFKSLLKREKGRNQRKEMDEGFRDFCKALLIHKHMLNPSISYSSLISAMWLLDISFKEKYSVADIRVIDEKVFDRAFDIAKSLYKPTTLFNISSKLEKISEIIFQNGFASKVYLKWKSPVRAPTPELYGSFEHLISEEGKLCGLKSIEALAAIFAKDDSKLSDQDIFTTSVFALLMCTPSRITEILSLPCDCEYHAIDQNGIERVGLRFYSLKGYGANIKWIPTIMIPVAKKAISRLKMISQTARQLVEEYDKKGLCERNGYECSRLSEGLNVEYKNALCLQKRKRLSKNKEMSEFNVRVLKASSFIKDISRSNPHNIFSRHGFLGDKNKPLFVNTHMARHLLNTIAYLGGMTDFDIARWSGRKNISQNKNYNHVSQEHIMDFMQNIPETPTTLDINSHDEVPVCEPEPDFSQCHGAFMIMDNGFCEHDYSIAPCKKYPGFNKDNKVLKEKFELLIKTSDKDKVSGVYGADKWANRDLIFKTRLQ